MFRFSGLCQFGVQEHSFSPCIGVIDTYDMREVKKLVKRRRFLLDTVCCDNIGRVERGLDSGAEKAGIYVRYSCYDDFCRKNPDVKGCIDMFYWYNGLYAFYRASEVREYLSGIAPAQIRPYGLSDQDCERILKESHGMCWFCGCTDAGNLSVQDTMPWWNPCLTVSKGLADNWRSGAQERDSVFCRALCPKCLRAWRRYFEQHILNGTRRWSDEHPIENFDKLVQGGPHFDGWERSLESFRQAAWSCISDDT